MEGDRILLTYMFNLPTLLTVSFPSLANRGQGRFTQACYCLSIAHISAEDSLEISTVETQSTRSVHQNCSASSKMIIHHHVYVQRVL
jgi:hypothetical protein